LRYDVYRASAVDPGTFLKIAETSSTFATYLDNSVQNGVTYLYTVAAVNLGSVCFSAIVAAHPTAARGLFNYPPVIYSQPVTQGTLGALFTYDVQAADPNGNILEYRLVNSPSGMTIDGASGLISWTPSKGTHDVLVEVSDGAGGSTTQGFQIAVAFANGAPIANAGQDRQVAPGSTVLLDGS